MFEYLKIVLSLIFFVAANIAVSGEELRTNPTFDYLNLEQYFRTEKFLNLQKRCLFEGGPCDLVGRWFKPRLPGALMGNCEMCTENQTTMVKNVVGFLKSEKPDVYEMAVKSFLDDEQVVVLVKTSNGIDSNTEIVFNGSVNENDPATAASSDVEETRSFVTKTRAAVAVPYPYVQNVTWVDFNLLAMPESDKSFRIPIITKAEVN